MGGKGTQSGAVRVHDEVIHHPEAGCDELVRGESRRRLGWGETEASPAVLSRRSSRRGGKVAARGKNKVLLAGLSKTLSVQGVKDGFSRGGRGGTDCRAAIKFTKRGQKRLGPKKDLVSYRAFCLLVSVRKDRLVGTSRGSGTCLAFKERGN